MPTNSPVPPVLKYLQITFFTGVILYVGKALFIPLFLSLLVAIVLYPLCKWLEHRSWPKSLAITASLGLVTVIFGLLVWIFSWQLQVFWLDLPQLIKKVEMNLPHAQVWIEETFGFTISAQANWFRTSSSVSNLTGLISNALNSAVNSFFYLILVPVFAALFLYHRRIFVQALRLMAGLSRQAQLESILFEAVNTYFKFIKGMTLVYLIVGILNSVGLMALGIRHAILFGMLTAVMTIIPYVGIIVSALLPISVAWLSKDSLWYPLGVVAVFSFVQYLEANVIFPMVVGTQLNISTWATLVAIIAGGILWGVSGMILFIPFLAILKIVSDHIEEWKPLNLLLSRAPG